MPQVSDLGTGIYNSAGLQRGSVTKIQDLVHTGQE